MAIILINTGGTISSHLDSKTGLLYPSPELKTILDQALLLSDSKFCEEDIKLITPFVIDSSSITLSHMTNLAKLVKDELDKDDVKGVIIAHGTDTLEETAIFLELTISSSKPLIITGAQKNHDAKDFDGSGNIALALEYIYFYWQKIFKKNCVSNRFGCAVAFNNLIFSSIGLTKIDTQNKTGFVGEVIWSKNGNNDSPITRTAKLNSFSNLEIATNSLKELDDQICIFYLYADCNLKFLDNLPKNTQIVILIATGSGNTNTQVEQKVIDWIKSKILVILTTRVATGKIEPVYGGAGSAASLIQKGVILSKTLRASQLRIASLLCLASNLDNKAIATTIEQLNNCKG